MFVFRRLFALILAWSVCVPHGAVAQDAPAPDEAEEESPRRRGAGSRDEVDTDNRRGGERDDVSAPAPTDEPTRAPAERVRDLPTGQSPTSVSPQSISLPSGEGSIEGMGESFTPNLSSGTGTFNVPLGMPTGRNGVQPSFGLSYGSSNGNGVVGIGWSVGVPFIARQTDRGTPSYRDGQHWQLGEDRFIYNGGQELVPVDSAAIAIVDSHDFVTTSSVGAALDAARRVPAGLETWQQYRAKVEGGFMRFFRSPDGRSWVVQSTDGTRLDFGALPTSEPGPVGLNRTSALQSEGPNGTGRIFSWLLTRSSDAHGSTAYYQYAEDGGARYVSDVYYVSPATCAEGTTLPSQVRRCTAPLGDYGVHVRFEYETRVDAFTGYVSGWGVTQNWRLKRVTSFAAENEVGKRYLVRRYHLSYDPNRFHSLLTSVMVEGRRDHDVAGITTYELTAEEDVGGGFVGRRLPPMTFDYTAMPTNGPIAPGFGGIDATPHPIASSPPVSLDGPLVDLFDVNGDGLDDVMVTDGARYRTQDGRPAVGVYWNGFTGPDAIPAAHGGIFSNATITPLEAGAEVVLRYTNPNLLGMDVDGDGRGDFMHLPPTLGHGWITPARLNATPAASPMQQAWAFVHSARPLSVPNDPQIHLAQDGTYYRVVDVNNDHLIDIVRTTGTSMQTWLNLSWIDGSEGRFGHAELADNRWVTSPNPITSCLPHDGLPLDFGNGEVRLGDMNGDGLSDIIRLRQGRVTYWPGRGGTVWGEGSSSCASGFASDRHVEMATPPTQLNAELAGVFLVDVDADGAADIVQVRYHQLDVWFNRAGHGFTNRITVDSPFAPDFAPNLRFVDIDGSGTIDLLYGRASQWQYVDLLGGERPRLLARVQNGLGATTSLEYGSSVEDYLRDLRAAVSCDGAGCDRFTWDGVRGDACDQVIQDYAGMCVYRSGGSPVISSVIRRVQTTDNLASVTGTNQVSTQEFAYHDGYYEGIEQEFRGFGAGDLHELGDSSVGGLWTRSYYHQGRRPNDVASSRTAENRDEALKGLEYLTEQRDEGGRYLSTKHSSVRLRRLSVGLDGRPITHPQVEQTDNFVYDSDSYVPQLAFVELPAVRWELVDEASGDEVVVSTEAVRAVVRATRYVWTQASSNLIDNLGQARKQTNYGRLHDIDDGAAPTPLNYHETIVSRAEPAFVDSSEDGWMVRMVDAYSYDLALPSLHLGATHSEFDAAGNELRQYQDVDDVTDLDFSPHYTYGGGAQRLETSTKYDSFGNIVESCGGANLATAGSSACVRHNDVTFDAHYSQLPMVEVVRVGGSSASVPSLETRATWNRGSGLMLTTTDPNNAVTTYHYDGLARATAANLPDGYGCATGGAPERRMRYALPDETGMSLGFVDTISDLRTIPENGSSTACAAARLRTVRTYVDGVGRTRATVEFGSGDQPSEARVSGQMEFDSRGNSRRAYDPRLVVLAGEPDAIAMLLPGPAQRSTFAQYDSFGRPVAVTTQDGSIARIEYHASLTVSFDANDDPQQNVESPQHHGTPHLVRKDGHDRTIEAVEVLRDPGEHVSSTRYIHILSRFRADGKLLEASRAENASPSRLTAISMTTVPSGHWTTRTFTYDTAGRRVSATDPNTDSQDGDATGGRRHWRYLYNRLDELVSIRDPRGCGQDFFYDRVGRLIGEDYIGCLEAQAVGGASVDVVTDAMGLNLNTSRDVDVRTYYDAPPWWAPPLPAGTAPGLSPKLRGRVTGSIDRSQRSTVAADDRGNPIWCARQMAVIAEAPTIATTRTGDSPTVDQNDTLGSSEDIEFDPRVYVTESRYDGGDRAFRRKYPSDPDWTLFRASGNTTSAPAIEGSLTFDDYGRPSTASVHIGAETHPVLASASYDAWGEPTEMRFISASVAEGITQTFGYDRQHRPLFARVERGANSGLGSGAVSASNLNALRVIFSEAYEWDRGSNLVRVTSGEGPEALPDRHRQSRKTVDYDSLNRVGHVSFEYLQDDQTWGSSDIASDYRDERVRPNDAGTTHEVADPMRSRPAPMLPPLPAQRLGDVTYSYDWLANQTFWEDDARSFHERSIGDITNGADSPGGLGGAPALRPSALYVASNLPTSESMALEPGNGWLDVDYGASGNVLAMTARAQCSNRGANQCVDNPTLPPAEREATLLAGCVCVNEQHFEYRWDELNRLVEARRYDRHAGETVWTMKARQRSRYDGTGQRVIKETIDAAEPNPDARERAHLYIFPGDFERTGVQARRDAVPAYVGSTALGTETEYRVAGARVVHKATTDLAGLERDHRSTFAVRDMLGTAGAVVDLESGHLVEMATYAPNGVRETHWMTTEVGLSPERDAWTAKEDDEEVGLTYFGARYLIARIGRWATPDPLSIHAAGGGELVNAYHYVGGNLLEARDATGLYGSTGHYYGVFVAALAVGLDVETANRIAYFTQLPDEVNESDAMATQEQVLRDRAHGVSGTPQGRQNVQDRNDTQRGHHALVTDGRAGDLSNVYASRAVQAPSNWQLGTALHALMDSFAHTTQESRNAFYFVQSGGHTDYNLLHSYPTGWGHAGDFTVPDDPTDDPVMFGIAMGQVYDVLAERFPNAQERMSREDFVQMMTSLAQDADNREELSGALQSAAYQRLGGAMPNFNPESHETTSMAEVRGRDGYCQSGCPTEQAYVADAAAANRQVTAVTVVTP